jgi:RNA-binding protein
MKELTSGQKKYLKGLSHHLEATVILGKSGLTDSLIKEIKSSLASHELIKVKFNKNKDNKKELAPSIAEQVEGQLVAVLGNHLVLFKEARKTENRRIKIPKE